MGKNATHVCPHCRQPARVRSSRSVTPLYRQINLQCSNIACGHTYAAALEILYSIVPSAVADPAVSLRTAPPRIRQLVPANDDPGTGISGPEVPPLAANDDDSIGEAIATGG